MFGEEGQERKDTSCDTCRTEQYEVDSPESCPSADTVNGSGGGKYKEEKSGLQRSGYPKAFTLFGSGIHNQFAVRYKRALNGITGNLCAGKCIH